MKTGSLNLVWKKKLIEVKGDKLCIYKGEEADEDAVEKSWYFFRLNILRPRKGDTHHFSIVKPPITYNVKVVKAKEHVEQKMLKHWSESLAALCAYWKNYYAVNPLPEDYRKKIQARLAKRREREAKRMEQLKKRQEKKNTKKKTNKKNDKKKDGKKQKQKKKKKPKRKKRKDAWLNPLNHFVSFVPYQLNSKETRICELDGCRKDPIFHGTTSQETFLEDCVAVIKESFIEKSGAAMQFSVMAFTKTPPKEEEKSKEKEKDTEKEQEKQASNGN